MRLSMLEKSLIAACINICAVITLFMLVRHLIINTTPSDRIGIYWFNVLRSDRSVLRGERVYIMPPRWVQNELRHVAPDVDISRPWMKTVVAVAGDTVCLTDDSVTINGVWRASRPLLQDYALIKRQGCTTLLPDTYFVMNNHARSFDSRYVGEMDRTVIRGTLTPIYTWEATP